MKRLLLFLLLCPAAFAITAQGIQSSNDNSEGLWITHPNAAPFTAITNWRVEFRFHSCVNAGGQGQFSQQNLWEIHTDGSCGSVQNTFWQDASASIGVSMPACPAGDYQARIQHSLSTSTDSVEVWCANSNAYAVSYSQSNFSSAPYNEGGDNMYVGYYANCVIDYFRFFSTAVALGERPSSNPGGDLADLEFDGNYTDSSSYAQTGGQTGPPSFVNTPVYAPVVSFVNGSNCFMSSTYPTYFCTVSNQTATLASSTFSPNLNDTLTYSWSELSGPSTATISNASSANATASGLSQFGEYDFQLTATDSEGNHTSATLPVGSVLVSTANPCIIDSVPANLQGLIGPLTPWGSSCDPWPWYDITEIGNEETLASRWSAALPASDSNAPKSGTITVDGSGNVTGTGTNFTSDCGSSCSVAILWNTADGNGTGRYLTTMYPSSSTAAALGNTPPSAILSGFSNVQYRVVNANDWLYWYSGTANYNYYDQAIGIYRIYYRTGITQFLTDARRLADYFWMYGVDHGYGTQIGPPRTYALAGEMVRAIEGSLTGRFPGMEHMVSVPDQSADAPHTTDPREAGYNSIYLGLLAEYDPNITGNPTNQTNYCNYNSNAVNNFWLSYLGSSNGIISGNYTAIYQHAYALNGGYPAYAYTIEPWQVGITASGFARLYDALTYCGSSYATAATYAKNLAVSFTNFLYLQGAEGQRTISPSATVPSWGQGRTGIAYIQGSPNTGENNLAPCSGPGAGVQQISGQPCTQGTISGTAGSPNITGSGTNFSSGNFGSTIPGNFLPNYLGIWGTTSGPGQEVHPICSITDDTHMTLCENVVTSFSNFYYQISPTDTQTAWCAPTQAQYCWLGDPSYVLEIGGIFGWTYHHTHQLLYRVWADDLYGTAYGGPAGGPGTLGPPVGPMASGATNTSYTYSLPSCGASNPPCGGASPNDHQGKEFGQGSGIAGAADNYFAYRLMLFSSE